MLAEALAIIRQTNPTRNVIVGPAFWNNVEWLDKLVLPRQDRHLIVTVHYYLPMAFTHQGAPWTPAYAKLSGNTWGTPADLATLEKDFDAVQAWARRNDRPILLGEFGAYDKAPMESRVKYTAAVARAAEQRGWAWAYWQFDRDFIVYDLDKDQWVEPIRGALIP
jgi:endoglucanase